MTENLIRSPADWAGAFRTRIAQLGLSHLEVDQLAGLPDGYCNKILNAKKKPGAVTIGRLCAALAMAFRARGRRRSRGNYARAMDEAKIAHLGALICVATCQQIPVKEVWLWARRKFAIMKSTSGVAGTLRASLEAQAAAESRGLSNLIRKILVEHTARCIIERTSGADAEAAH